jgi:uncharacterized protein
MEVVLDKRYPVAATLQQAWAVLSDIHTTSACMPGAQITEQVGDTHYKGAVKTKIGPASMSFAGDIEVQGLDASALQLKMLGKGADKAGSSAAMQLTAQLVAGDSASSCVLVGHATVTVSGKLAQFGSRLLVPVSDAMLAQFAANFDAAAQAVALEPLAAAPTAQAASAAELEPPAVAAPTAPAVASVAAVAAAHAVPAAPRAPQAVKELNALALMWTVVKGWLAGIFGKRP